MSTFIAQYHGACGECEGDLKDTEVVYRDDELIHVKCPEALDEIKPGETCCPRCLTFHRGEC